MYTSLYLRIGKSRIILIIFMYAHILTDTYTCMYTHTHTHSIFMYAYILTDTYTCIYTHTYIHTYIPIRSP